MKKNILWRHLFASIVLLLSALSGTTWAQTSNFFYGFETPPSVPNDWSSDIRVPGGTNGIPASSGSSYGNVPVHNSSSVGTFTRFGGYNSVFPPCGFKTSLNIYLDPAKPWANDTRFDWSAAINTPAGLHRRDFVFNVGFYNDATAPGAGPRFVISASNSAGRANSFPKNPGRNPQIIAANAWYTFEHSFRNNGGVLAVDMTIYFGNIVVAAWTLSDPSDVIGTTVGGNRYGWIVNNEFNPLGVDNAALTTGDADQDGICDNVDNCPTTANADQADTDGDGIGNVCDACPNDAANDADGDGVCGNVDNCPSVFNPDQLNSDNDGLGNACDPDDDNDGILDGDDNCPLNANAGQADNDADGIGDPCDPDDDNDGILDGVDNCPKTANANQTDADNDGQGDVCDVSCGKKNDKVRMCHNGKEICVSPNAVQSHLNHGDKLGPCSYAPCEGKNNFSKPIVLSPTQAPGKWYTDRYAPAGFVSPVNFGGNARLKHSIASADGANTRPPAFSSAFYNTQGRKFDLTQGATYMEIQLYVPLAWKTTGRRMAGFWGTAFDAFNNISGYPILEFTSEAGPARFRGFNNGVWIDMGLPAGFAYNKWVTLSIELLPSGEFKYRVGSLQATTTTLAASNSKQIGNVILQGHNTTTGVNYDIYWDNFEFRCYKGSDDDDDNDDDEDDDDDDRNSSKVFLKNSAELNYSRLVIKNYPNPFTNATKIQYTLPYDSKVSIKVYDMIGRVVSNLVNGERNAGTYVVDFDGSKLGAGNYYYRINAISKQKEFSQTGSMIKAK